MKKKKQELLDARLVDDDRKTKGMKKKSERGQANNKNERKIKAAENNRKTKNMKSKVRQRQRQLDWLVNKQQSVADGKANCGFSGRLWTWRGLKEGGGRREEGCTTTRTKVREAGS